MTTQALNIDRLQRAADWFILLKEAPPEEVLTEWMDWCEADPQNLTAFEEIKAVWSASSSYPAPRGKVGMGASLARPIALAAAILLALFAILFFRDRFISTPPTQSLSTPLAMHSDSVLEDGSRLALGGLSKVSTQYSSERRLIVVESGEAFFHVAKDTQRPFVVQVGPVAVTAIGTEFNVRRGAQRVVVTVTEGRVGVAAENRQPVHAEAGQEISYSATEQQLAVAPVNAALATSWQQGIFKYVREPLTDVVADLNRYSERRIVIADEALGQERYTGTVFGSRVEDWLEALQSAFPVRVVETPDAIRVVKRTE
jgi:transmembrane sensor